MTYPDPAVKKELEGWLRLSVDVDEHPEIAEPFAVLYLPLAVALDAEGRVLARIQGFQSPEPFAQALAAARTGGG